MNNNDTKTDYPLDLLFDDTTLVPPPPAQKSSLKHSSSFRKKLSPIIPIPQPTSEIASPHSYGAWNLTRPNPQSILRTSKDLNKKQITSNNSNNNTEEPVAESEQEEYTEDFNFNDVFTYK